MHPPLADHPTTRSSFLLAGKRLATMPLSTVRSSPWHEYIPHRFLNRHASQCVSGVTRESVRRHARPQMFAEPCPSRTSSIKVYDGADEVCGDVLLVDVRFGPPVSEPIAFLRLVTAA